MPKVFWVAAALLPVWSCVGELLEVDPPPAAPAPGPPPREGPPPAVPPPAADPCLDAPSAVPVAPAQRLTRGAYVRSIQTLLGLDATEAVETLPADVRAHGLTTADPVSPLSASQLFEVARSVAEDASTRLPEVTGCAADARECLRGWIASTLPVLFRGRVEGAAGSADLLQLFDEVAEETDPRFGFETALIAALASPRFLYRVELSPPGAAEGDVVPLDGAAQATRLAFFLWNAPPDAALLQRATAGDLQTPAGLARVVDDMLEDPRSRAGFSQFLEEWLNLRVVRATTKPDDRAPEFDGVALTRSLEETLVHWLWTGEGTLDALYTAADFVPYGPAASYLGMGSAPDGVPTMAPNPNVRGLLSHPALMAHYATDTYSDPVLRGVFVLDALLCDKPPPPPNNIEIRPPDPNPNLTTRERFAQHSEDPGCRPCHDKIDPLGFGLENFDELGRYRTEDGGRPVDASGALITLTENASFVGVKELSDLMDQSTQARTCAVRRMYRTALRRVELDAERCEMQALFDQSEAEGWGVKATFRAIALSPAFTQQRVEGGTP